MVPVWVFVAAVGLMAGMAVYAARRALAAERDARVARETLAAERGEYAAYHVELYNFNGLPMMDFYAGESRLSPHIFTAKESNTVARIRVTRLHAPEDAARIVESDPVATDKQRMGSLE